MAVSRRILLLAKALGAAKPLLPPAWNYDILIGTIWLEDTSQYSYDNRSEGSIPIELRDPYGTAPAGDLNGGSYDNRQ